MNWPFTSTAATRPARFTLALGAAPPVSSSTVTRIDPNGCKTTLRSTVSSSNDNDPLAPPSAPLTGSRARNVKCPADTPAMRKLPSARVETWSLVEMMLEVLNSTLEPVTPVTPSAFNT